MLTAALLRGILAPSQLTKLEYPMAYERAGTGAWAWIKSVGSAEEPLNRDWRYHNVAVLRDVWFSKHPRSLRAGDALVYYAARWGVFPALMELVSDDVFDHSGERGYTGRWR